MERLLAKFSKREKKVVEELKAKINVVARFKEEVAELKKNKALTKKFVEEYKSSNNFQEAVVYGFQILW